MRETEITVQVFEDLDVIFTKLKRLGFEQVRQCQLNDWYYTHLPTDTKVVYPALLKNSFLVRQVIDSDTKKAYLYYKDKEIDQKGNVVSEEKIKIEISNLADALKIFAKAGINCWCELQQTMYVFRQGKIEFAVQAVAGLGNFIEYEEDETIGKDEHPTKNGIYVRAVKKFAIELRHGFVLQKSLPEIFARTEQIKSYKIPNCFFWAGVVSWW